MPDYLVEHERSGKPSRLPPLAKANPNQIMTFFEWVQLNNLSVSTGRRLLKAGQGPVVIWLSKKRIGITVAANRRWQQARKRK